MSKSELKRSAVQSGPSSLPWGACHGGDCKCGQIWSETDDHPVATVTVGEWGDEYPSLRFVEGTTRLDSKVEAYIERTPYGEVPAPRGAENAKLIVKAVNSHAALVSALEGLVGMFHEHENNKWTISMNFGAILTAKQVLEEAK